MVVVLVFFCREFCITHSCDWWSTWRQWLLAKNHTQKSGLWIRGVVFWVSFLRKITACEIASCFFAEEMSFYLDALLFWGRIYPVSSVLMPPLFFAEDQKLEFIKALEKKFGRKTGIQFPFSLTLIQFEQLMQKPSFKVMWKSDCFWCYGLQWCTWECGWMKAAINFRNFWEGWVRVIIEKRSV